MKIVFFSTSIVINKEGKPFIIVELYTNSNRILLSDKRESINNFIKYKNARFGILTNGYEFELTDKYKPKSNYEKLEFDEIIRVIKSAKKFELQNEHKRDIHYAFKSAAINFLNGENITEMINLIDSTTFINNLEYNDSLNSIVFKKSNRGLNSIENKIFRLLLGDNNEYSLCRYTSLDALFSMLNNKSIRMNGLVGMNDKTEVSYADNYLNGKERKLIDLHHSSIIAINKRYITSCTEENNKDKLTMWRLYADDAKGVCLTFNIKKDKLNRHTLLHKVKYASESKEYEDDKENIHDELDFLKFVIKEVEHTTGFKFKFTELKYYKHFFKPYGYREEDEVRLLIIDNDKLNGKENWVKTYSHSIINPVIDFPINGEGFPLKLTEIILGPKCPEMEINKVQIEEMLRRKRAEIKANSEDSNLEGIKVNLSSITDYR